MKTLVKNLFHNDDYLWITLIVSLTILVGLMMLAPETSFAAGQLPGSDESGKLDAAGTMLRLIDTGLFKWGAKIFAGICIMSAGWALKEQRFGTAIICVVGALTFGTAPTWVKNIFEVGGNSSLFSQVESNQIVRV